MKLAKPKSERPLSLPDLLSLNRNAVTVYAALRWLAGEKRQLGTVRERIREVCHLSKEVITDAMKALKESNWLTFSYGSKPGKNYRWYRITFAVADFFPTTRDQGRPPAKAQPASSGRPPLGATNPSPTKHGETQANANAPGETAFVDEDGIEYVRLSNGALRPASIGCQA